ncbi:hypothetical protein PR202_gb00613 [Eleusine coracana subsp. coracana]|uniref:Uncharacterized protein n=1 Tax=Eleusine coracana subsp. coracana TaxID=191504 RepID=A0AAV5DTT5_ELECO|nr:hypothetical protein PR202_gb00613 [Eleusine coracana subsp. coracana]
MERQKRKKTRDRHGRRAKARFDKPKPSSVEDPELEEREDRDRNRAGYLDEIVSDDWQEADADRQARDLDLAGIDSREIRDRSAYLVACHWDWSMTSRRYSVYKMVDLAASSSARGQRLKRLGCFKADAAGKVFTSVSSRNRAWIVGVGGDHGETVIFDTSSSSNNNKVIQGPNLNSAKRYPILMTIGDKVYAMSKTPSWISDPDFPPWFEVLDLSKAKVVTIAGKLHLEDCSWTPLPHPPCMPWELSLTGFTRLPIVILMSYVVVGTYILVSFNEPWGTYAFDTNAQEWHKVDEDNLPFTGRATPLIGSVFLAEPRKKVRLINAYRIHVTTSDDGDNNPLIKLSIAVLPVKYMGREVRVGPAFSSMDNESFCSLNLSVDTNNLTYRHDTGAVFPRTVHANLTRYQIEDPSSLLENREEDMLAVNPEVAIYSEQEHILNITSKTHVFFPCGFCLVLM